MLKSDRTTKVKPKRFSSLTLFLSFSFLNRMSFRQAGIRYFHLSTPMTYLVRVCVCVLAT